MSLPGGSEWIIILFIVLLFFGARKLPDLAGSFGKSIKEFRKSSKDAFDEGRVGADDDGQVGADDDGRGRADVDGRRDAELEERTTSDADPER